MSKKARKAKSVTIELNVTLYEGPPPPAGFATAFRRAQDKDGWAKPEDVFREMRKTIAQN